MEGATTYFEDNTSTNQKQNIDALVKEHNKDKDGLIVSIHFNASGGTQNRAIGTEVLYYDQKDLAAKIAEAISDATGGGLLNRGAKQRKDLGVLASTYEPAILIEICFVNSTIDAAIYQRDFEKICQAIAEVLAAAVGKRVTSKGDVEMEFSSPTLKVKTDALIKDKNAQKDLIAKGIKAGAFNKSWQDAFDKGELKKHDIIGLATLYALAK